MTGDLKPYPEYKDSGVPWLGRVPEHWDIRRAKFLFRCVDIRSQSGEEELLTVSAEHGIVPRNTAKVTMFKAESYVGYKLCWPNDLVINSLWAWGRGLGVAKHHGIISSAYGVYRLRPGLNAYSDYIHHLVRSVAFHWELRTRSKGVWISRLQLTDDAFLGAPMPLPPPMEASAIVRFITAMDRRVRRFIRNRRRLIEVLNEYKQAIINQYVTGQIDPRTGRPYPRYKPSGIDWLGDIPAHWQTVRLGLVIDLLTGFPFESAGFTEDPSDIRLLRGINVSPGRVRWESVVRWPASDVTRFSAFLLSEGDIVFGMDRPIITGGIRVAMVGPQDVPSLLLQRVARIRARAQLEQQYLLLLLQDRRYADYLTPNLTGISVPHVSPAQISEYRVALAPWPEQRSILEKISRETKASESVISRAKGEIDLIREYRTRLIADVVTGKLDVRGLAPAAGEDIAETEDWAEDSDEEAVLQDDQTDLVEEAADADD